MLRKLGLVVVAAASLGAAALAPTQASAWGGGWHGGGWHGGGWHRGGWGGPASWSAARLITVVMVTAAVTCADWSRPRGARAGA
jgi:hypothetical protein